MCHAISTGHSQEKRYTKQSRDRHTRGAYVGTKRKMEEELLKDDFPGIHVEGDICCLLLCTCLTDGMQIGNKPVISLPDLDDPIS
jgi:hypothetical protein